MTMIASFGGGCFGILYALQTTNGETVDLITLINAILGALVSITAGCFLYNGFESLLIGVIGGFIACYTMPLVDMVRIYGKDSSARFDTSTKCSPPKKNPFGDTESSAFWHPTERKGPRTSQGR